MRDDGAGANHSSQSFSDTIAIDHAVRQHAGLTQHTLEGEGYDEEEQAAEQAGIEDRLEGIGLRIPELARIAHRGLKTVGGPGGDIEAPEEERPAAQRPGTINAGIKAGRRHERRDIGQIDLAHEDRQYADDQQGNENNDRKPFLRTGGRSDAAMLNGEDDQHHDGANKEHAVDVHRGEIGDVELQQVEGLNGGCQCRNRILGEECGHRILRGLAGIGRIGQPLDGAGRFSGERCRIGGDPLQHGGRFCRGDGGDHVENIERRDGAAERQDGAPGEPVAPHRQRRDEFRIAQPGGCSVYGGSAGFAAEHAGHFGIREGLQEAHDHRDDPDKEGKLAGGAGDAADREQHQGRHAGRDPEGALPV